MRRRRSNARLRLTFAVCAAAAVAAFVATARAAAAQGTVTNSNEGALFLLIPVGALAVGMGQAVVAAPIGIESIWWNPAALARMDTAEVAINHAQTFASNNDALTFVLPKGRAGVIAVTAYLVDNGTQNDVDINGNFLGTSDTRDIVLAASYAATFGSRFTAGLTYKYIQDRLDCSGDCSSIATHQSSTSAIDFGIQMAVDSARRLTLGLAASATSASSRSTTPSRRIRSRRESTSRRTVRLARGRARDTGRGTSALGGVGRKPDARHRRLAGRL